MSTPPGLPEQVRARTTLRVTGSVLLVAGLLLVAEQGLYTRRGTRDDGASFCDHCGHALAG